MALNDITFIKGQSGLGRPLPGEDHICGLLVFGNVIPNGFGNDLTKQYLALSQAEADGILEGDANFGALWYHISEFFRLNKQGILWVQIAAIPLAYDFTEIVTLQRLADGKIRKVGVWVTGEAFDVAHVTALQVIKEQLDTEHTPLSIMYAPEISGIADISTLPDLSALDSEGVSVLIAQDGAAVGASLFATLVKTVSCIGAALGAWSEAKVSESFAWVAKFPMASALGELDVPAFGNGQIVKGLDPAILDALNTSRYIFLIKHIGLTDTYFNDTHTATLESSDYAYIENNTTIDKAIRGVRTNLLPQLNGPVTLDPVKGTLSEEYVEFLRGLGDDALAQMARDGELSGFQTIIDPTQDVQASGNIDVSIENVQVGVSRKFTVKIGYVKQLS